MDEEKCEMIINERATHFTYGTNVTILSMRSVYSGI